jgi:hypothetical protein
MINAMVPPSRRIHIASARQARGRWSRGHGLWSVVVVTALLCATALDAQTRPSTRKPAPAARKQTVAPAEMTCPSPLGMGVKTKREYCDVLTGRDPKEGILIKLPPHRGPVTLRFSLHNRHTYSEEEVRMKRGFASYIAGIGVLTLDNTLLTRAAIATEFRQADDLLERITGGAGPGGVKAVAPVGVESITLQLAAELSEVTILGEKLTVVRADGQPANYAAPGRPIAIISDVTVEYTPAPPARRK